MTEELLHLVPEDLRARVESGELEVLPGEDPLTPVVRDAVTKRLQPGSGRYPRKPKTERESDEVDAIMTDRVLRATTYREALEAFLPLIPTEEGQKSFRDLLSAVVWAIEGAPQKVKCENCGKKQVWVQKPDAATGFKLIENLVGKATETQVIHNSYGDRLIRILEMREPTVEVYDVTPAEVAERRQAMLEAGILEEGEFLAV